MEKIEVIARGKSISSKKKRLLKSNNVNIATKKRFSKNVYAVSTDILHGSGTWTVGKRVKTLMGFETWCWRRFQNIWWIEIASNYEVLKKLNQKWIMYKQLNSSRNKWTEHPHNLPSVSSFSKRENGGNWFNPWLLLEVRVWSDIHG